MSLITKNVFTTTSPNFFTQKNDLKGACLEKKPDKPQEVDQKEAVTSLLPWILICSYLKPVHILNGVLNLNKVLSERLMESKLLRDSLTEIYPESSFSDLKSGLRQYAFPDDMQFRDEVKTACENRNLSLYSDEALDMAVSDFCMRSGFTLSPKGTLALMQIPMQVKKRDEMQLLQKTIDASCSSLIFFKLTAILFGPFFMDATKPILQVHIERLQEKINESLTHLHDKETDISLMNEIAVNSSLFFHPLNAVRLYLERSEKEVITINPNACFYMQDFFYQLHLSSIETYMDRYIAQQKRDGVDCTCYGTYTAFFFIERLRAVEKEDLVSFLLESIAYNNVGMRFLSAMHDRIREGDFQLEDVKHALRAINTCLSMKEDLKDRYSCIQYENASQHVAVLYLENTLIKRVPDFNRIGVFLDIFETYHNEVEDLGYCKFDNLKNVLSLMLQSPDFLQEQSLNLISILMMNKSTFKHYMYGEEVAAHYLRNKLEQYIEDDVFSGDNISTIMRFNDAFRLSPEFLRNDYIDPPFENAVVLDTDSESSDTNQDGDRNGLELKECQI